MLKEETMHPYKNTRLIEYPDVADIQEQGRKSSVGRIPRGDTQTVYPNGLLSKSFERIKRNDRGYCKPEHKKRVRRYLKRADRARSLKEALELENQAEIDGDLQDMMEQDMLDCEDYDDPYWREK
jgi:hypothetical protein